MRIGWTAYFMGMAVFFTFIFVNTVVYQKGKVGITILPLIALIVVFAILAVRWWLARIVLEPNKVTMVKLFRIRSVPIESIDYFDFVTGRFGFYVYVGAIHDSKVVLRSSYGPIQNIVAVRKSSRMTAYLEELNRSLESCRNAENR